MTYPTSEAGDDTYETESGVKYRPHSMMHRAILRMDPTKLEMLDGFEKTKSGHTFSPNNSNVRVVITGRDWSKKRILIYGSKSSEEAKRYVETIIDSVTGIGHNAELIDGPEITNIAVNGDFGNPLKLEYIVTELNGKGIDIEYEPEQFPAAIAKVDEPPVTFLLFSTGKFIIQGLRSFNDIEPAIEHVHSLFDWEP